MAFIRNALTRWRSRPVGYVLADLRNFDDEVIRFSDTLLYG